MDPFIKDTWGPADQIPCGRHSPRDLATGVPDGIDYGLNIIVNGVKPYF